MAAPATLNLSNEVVKMRAEVKRVKVLVIRKLTRLIEDLRKKKGKEAALEKNQRRITRLIEEIREIKGLEPDSITKAALQKDISFEKVCQNKDASLAERAIARVATHAEFSRRIQSIKKAIEAFKAERTGHAKAKGIIQQQSESEQDGEDEEGTEESGKKQKGDGEMSQKVDAEQKSETDSTPAEVVRMRKEVKKVRILVFRTLSQQIASLKKMKGEESELKGNKESAARLMKEVQVLRGLLPDHVTTRALQGNIDAEAVLQDPESSPLERVTVRIATHARFVKKLQDVREAIEKERTGADKKNKGEEKSIAEDSDQEEEDEAEEGGIHSNDHGDADAEDDDDDDDDDDDNDDDDDDDDDGNDDDATDDNTEDNKKKTDKNQTPIVIKRSSVVKPPENIRSASVVLPSKEKTSTTKPTAEVNKQAVSSANPKNIPKTPVSVGVAHSLPTKSKETPAKKAPSSRQDTKPETEKPENNKAGEEESDLESSDGEEEEEKEYFDDSTEERFHKQSSLSEESDEDDFFLGKVTKLKKKKSSAPGKDKTGEPKPAVEVKEGPSPDFKMQSVFCSTLSKSSGASTKGQPHGPKPPRFQNQRKHADGDGRPSWFKSQGPGTDRRPPAAGPRAPGARQMGGPSFERPQAHKAASGKPFRPPQHSQQVLHPSWEASRKRKEQQSQITAFQGKKIKFDDDDD